MISIQLLANWNHWGLLLLMIMLQVEFSASCIYLADQVHRNHRSFYVLPFVVSALNPSRFTCCTSELSFLTGSLSVPHFSC